ncbi:uncharacterized protein [Miscanthus floridulus]|uniref:uncharacterized protein n=1 Tax=Miscanthus floridulus TaxID=154761 RepID=UPI0034589E55
MPGKQAMPLGQIDMPITFRDPSNYRMEILTFEVVEFPRTYHAILGRPCYAKFMAVPNYTYLKLKIPGPNEVITVGTSFHPMNARPSVVIMPRQSSPLKSSLPSRMRSPKKCQTPKKSIRSFEPMEGSKEVHIDPNSPDGKVVRIGTMLSSK